MGHFEALPRDIKMSHCEPKFIYIWMSHESKPVHSNFLAVLGELNFFKQLTVMDAISLGIIRSSISTDPVSLSVTLFGAL